MFEIVVARCPACLRQFHAFDEEEAQKKYDEHECLAKVSDRSLRAMLSRILRLYSRRDNGRTLPLIPS